MHTLLLDVWRDALDRLDAATLAREALTLAPIPPGAWVLALGKAAAPLARGALDALRAPGRVLVAGGTPTDPLPGSVEVLVGEHPVPGPGSYAAGARLLAWAAEARDAEVPVVALLSGGASALCEVPAAGIPPGVLAEVQRGLVQSGAPIDEVNLVRRHLSALKGGGLGAALGERLVWLGVLSDVPAGGVEAVGSSPFLATPWVPGEAARLLRHHLGAVAPAEALAFLEGAATGAPPPRPPAAPPTAVLADPARLAAEAAEVARQRGLGPVTVRPAPVAGVDAEALAEEVLGALDRPGLWVAAGEAGVKAGLAGGKGGRGSHLASLVWRARHRRGGASPWAFLAGASDGRDGTGGAGAVVSSALALDPERVEAALAAYDTAPVLEAAGALLPGHPPHTNLTDLFLAWNLGSGPIN